VVHAAEHFPLGDADELPLIRYRDLPLVPGTELRHAWQVFPEGDRIGSLNRLTPASALRGIATVRTGEVMSLDLPLGTPDPPLFGRRQFEHSSFSTSGSFFEDRIDQYFPQSGTQWDSLGHVRLRGVGFYGGRTVDPTERNDLGVDAYAEKGMVGRGVLLDVARYFEQKGEPLDPASNRHVTAADLEGARARQGVTIEAGDFLLLRTGWRAWYRKLTPAGRQRAAADLRSPGLEGSDEVAALLWDWGIAALAADNPAVEPVPGDAMLHRRLIPMLGTVIGELFDLEELADRVEADGRSEFLFASVPLRLPGGLGSPANAIAVW
jgi:kynurenine formamidase